MMNYSPAVAYGVLGIQVILPMIFASQYWIVELELAVVMWVRGKSRPHVHVTIFI